MQTLRYGTVAIALHWIIVALIVVAFVLGLTVDNFPKAYVSSVINLHAIIGLSILFLTLVRLGWRLTNRPPDLPTTATLLIRRVSKLTHALLYLLMFLVPMIGIPTLLYRGRGIDFGFFQIAPLVPRTPEIFHPLTDVHEYAAFALVALAIGHMLAAAYHQLVLRDGLLSRMGVGRS